MKPVRESDVDPTELFRLLGEARRCLEGTDLSGATAALIRANAEAAMLGDGATLGDHRKLEASEDRG